MLNTIRNNPIISLIIICSIVIPPTVGITTWFYERQKDNIIAQRDAIIEQKNLEIKRLEAKNVKCDESLKDLLKIKDNIIAQHHTIIEQKEIKINNSEAKNTKYNERLKELPKSDLNKCERITKELSSNLQDCLDNKVSLNSKIASLTAKNEKLNNSLSHCDCKDKELSGTWDTNWGEMELNQSGNNIKGRYSNPVGEIDGRLIDDILEGYWVQTKSGRDCNKLHNGTSYWGTFRISFDKDRFYGRWGYCDGQQTDGDFSGTKKKKIRISE